MRQTNLATFVDLAPVEESFREAALSGLSSPRKSIPCRFLYDERGSALFDAICDLPEYYVTRTEIRILKERAGEIAALAGPRCQLVEFGSGASRKVKLILSALETPLAYIPIDISPEFLRQTAAGIVKEFPGVDVIAVCADFAEPQHLPDYIFWPFGSRLGFFPGSTIGNLMPGEAVSFLSGCYSLLGAGGGMVVGVDLKKDPDILHDAYNDADGATAAFTLNLLQRMNREIDGDFDIGRFSHEAFYNASAGRIEIYIRSLMNQIVGVAGRRIAFAADERIHVEYSYKYTIEEFQRLAARAGFSPSAVWTDRNNLFSLHFLKAR
jgi:dimethylhistidine N-methyltransferase